MQTLALTDINNTSACLDFVRLSSEYDIKPVLGVDFRNGAQQQFILLAKNNHGFQQINAYLSVFMHDNRLKVPDHAAQLENTFVIYPYVHGKTYHLNSNEYLGVKPEDINKLRFSIWHTQREKLVILQTVSFQSKNGFNTHRLLRAIANNTLLSKLPLEEQGSETDQMLQYDELHTIYAAYPELIENTKQLLEKCHVSFDFSQNNPKNQRSYTNNEALDYRLLERLTYQGLSYRYKDPDEVVYSRIRKELHIVKEKGFVSYFLINWKILKYARSKGYFYVGRGSGANSIVAYLLRITDVDPVELDL